MKHIITWGMVFGMFPMCALKVELVSGCKEVMRDSAGRKRPAYKTWPVPDECINMFANVAHIPPEMFDDGVFEYRKKMTPDDEHVKITIHEPFASYSEEQPLLFDATLHLIKMLRYSSKQSVEELRTLYAPHALHLVMISELLGLTSQPGYGYVPQLVEKLLSTDSASIALWGPYLITCVQTSQTVSNIVGRVLRGESNQHYEISVEARVALLVSMHNNLPSVHDSGAPAIQDLHACIRDAVDDLVRTPDVSLSTSKRELLEILFREKYQCRHINEASALDRRRRSSPAALWHSSGGMQINPGWKSPRRRAASSPVKIPHPPLQPPRKDQRRISSFRAKRLTTNNTKNNMPTVGFSLPRLAPPPYHAVSQS